MKNVPTLLAFKNKKKFGLEKNAPARSATNLLQCYFSARYLVYVVYVVFLLFVL